MVKHSVMYLPFILLATIFSIQGSSMEYMLKDIKPRIPVIKAWFEYITKKSKGLPVSKNQIDILNEFDNEGREMEARLKAALARDPDNEMLKLRLKNIDKFKREDREQCGDALPLECATNLLMGITAKKNKVTDNVGPIPDLAEKLKKTRHDISGKFKEIYA